MTKSIFTLFFLTSCYLLTAQSYSVIHVAGKIYLPEKETYLSRGMKLDADSELEFKDGNSRAAVLSSDMGRFIIQGSSSSSTPNDLLYVLSSVISPARGKMSTRSGSINNILDFQKAFQNPLAWISDSLKVQVSETAYPVNTETFFFARYKVDGELVNKKLTMEDGRLLFVKNEYFSVDGNSVLPEQTSGHQLYYYNASEKTSTFITDISLNPISPEEIGSMAQELRQVTENEKIVILHEIVSSLYGKSNMEDIKKVINL